MNIAIFLAILLIDSNNYITINLQLRLLYRNLYLNAKIVLIKIKDIFLVKSE